MQVQETVEIKPMWRGSSSGEHMFGALYGSYVLRYVVMHRTHDHQWLTPVAYQCVPHDHGIQEYFILHYNSSLTLWAIYHYSKKSVQTKTHVRMVISFIHTAFTRVESIIATVSPNQNF